MGEASSVVTAADIADLLVAADPAPPGTDEVAHYYTCLGDAEAAMPVVNALAAAGLLVLPDGERRWAVTDPDFPDTFWPQDTEEMARRKARKWPHVKLLRRGYGRWVEVSDGD